MTRHHRMNDAWAPFQPFQSPVSSYIRKTMNQHLALACACLALLANCATEKPRGPPALS